MTARIRSVGPQVDRVAGQNVRRLRESLGWSRNDLAFQVRLVTGVDLSVAVIGAMEDPDRDRRITLGEADVLARTFKVPLEALTREIR